MPPQSECECQGVSNLDQLSFLTNQRIKIKGEYFFSAAISILAVNPVRLKWRFLSVTMYQSHDSFTDEVANVVFLPHVIRCYGQLENRRRLYGNRPPLEGIVLRLGSL